MPEFDPLDVGNQRPLEGWNDEVNPDDPTELLKIVVVPIPEECGEDELFEDQDD